jgi:hypothetical protein
MLRAADGNMPSLPSIACRNNLIPYKLNSVLPSPLPKHHHRSHPTPGIVVSNRRPAFYHHVRRLPSRIV